MEPAPPATDAPIAIRTGYRPGVIGRIGELHGRYYAHAWGSGAAFEIQMIRALCAFFEEDRGDRIFFTAHAGERLIGSLAVQPTDRGRAQLRFVIVDPDYQGRRAGRAMLDAALSWCRDQGVATLFLWTVEGLPVSRAMYERAGFRVVERVEDARYSVPLTSIRMELALAASGPRTATGPAGSSRGAAAAGAHGGSPAAGTTST